MPPEKGAPRGRRASPKPTPSTPTLQEAARPSTAIDNDNKTTTLALSTPKRGRGRPRKNSAATRSTQDINATAYTGPLRDEREVIGQAATQTPNPGTVPNCVAGNARNESVAAPTQLNIRDASLWTLLGDLLGRMHWLVRVILVLLLLQMAGLNVAGMPGGVLRAFANAWHDLRSETRKAVLEAYLRSQGEHA